MERFSKLFRLVGVVASAVAVFSERPVSDLSRTAAIAIGAAAFASTLGREESFAHLAATALAATGFATRSDLEVCGALFVLVFVAIVVR